jgi:hypothetical protein
MPLAASDFLAPVVPPLAANLGLLDRLAVDAPSTGRRFAAAGVVLSIRFTEYAEDVLPDAAVPPRREVLLQEPSPAA